jgi:hypothetical protein
MVGRLKDDQNAMLNLQANAYPMAGDKTVLNSPAQIAGFRRQLADKGADMAMSAATVWHGSPHKFDKFDSSKIGTGEGAQAYGHGLYLAESPDVAKGYQKALSGYAADGKRLPSDVGAVVSNFNGDIGAALAAKQGQLDKWMATGADKKHFIVKGLQDDIKKLSSLNGKSLESTGALYKVDLPDEHIAKMLDWDKPLSQQAPQEVKDAFNAIIQKYPELKDKFFQAFKEGKPGNHYYSLLNDYAKTGDLVKNQTFASDAMRQAGIPGIRYLDGGSRGAGAGSSNYVVFPGNEGLLSILERNGQAIK